MHASSTVAPLEPGAVQRTRDLARVVAIMAREAGQIARLHAREGLGPDAVGLAALRAAEAAAALDQLPEEAGPEEHLEGATWTLHAAALALGQARRGSAWRKAGPRTLAPASHHQRCLACGKSSLANTVRSAVTFRHRHRKHCPGAEFETMAPEPAIVRRPWSPTSGTYKYG